MNNRRSEEAHARQSRDIRDPDLLLLVPGLREVLRERPAAGVEGVGEGRGEEEGKKEGEEEGKEEGEDEGTEEGEGEGTEEEVEGEKEGRFERTAVWSPVGEVRFATFWAWWEGT